MQEFGRNFLQFLIKKGLVKCRTFSSPTHKIFLVVTRKFVNNSQLPLCLVDYESSQCNKTKLIP